MEQQLNRERLAKRWKDDIHMWIDFLNKENKDDWRFTLRPTTE